MIDSISSSNNIDKVRRAISEVLANKDVFSQDTQAQILVILYEKLRQLQTEDTPANKNESDWKPREDEIRLVTVMFIDVMQSTRIAQQLGNEDWRIVIGETHNWLGEIVSRWDGEIGQYLGDGQLCFFGAQHSRNDDAARAVACALAIQEGSVEYARNMQKIYPHMDDFMLRIGISTGRVVVGTIGTAAKSETLAVGTTTNLAARLQEVCLPGSVVIDTETFRRVRLEFATTEQPGILLKGFDEVTPYFIVTGQHHQSATHLTSDRIGDIILPFIGRWRFFKQIIDQMYLVTQKDHNRVITVYGDIGLGKSRLLQEVAHGELANQFEIIRMSGNYERNDLDYSLVRDMLAVCCDLSEALDAETAEKRIMDFTIKNWGGEAGLAKSAAAITGFLSGYGFAGSSYVQTLNRSIARQANEQYYEWIMLWLQGITKKQHLLLLVDNLQWADDESLMLLMYLSQHLEKCVILGAAHPEFKEDHPAYMIQQKYHTTFELPPFTEAYTYQLIETVLSHVDQVPPDLAGAIVERAEGNPLFVEEFLRMLFDNGVFEAIDNNHWRFNTFEYRMMEGTDALPRGLLGVFQSRLDDMVGPARRVVQIASVVGQTFWEGSITHIAGATIRPILENLLIRGIIVEHPESRFANDREFVFRNVLYHEVAYAMMTRTQRYTYHQKVAEWLVLRVDSHPDTLSLLAEQYFKGGESVSALKTYVEAAAYQIDRGNLAETLKLVEDGLDTARHVAREEALPLVSRLWLLQARTNHSRRRYSEATAASKTALMLMSELPETEMVTERIRAAVTLGNAYTSMGNYEAALDALTNAYELIDDDSSPVEQANALRAFGTLFWSRGNLHEAVLYQERALIAAEASNDERETAATLSMLGRIAHDKGEFVKALEYFEKVLAINFANDNFLYQVLDYQLVAMTYRHLFAYDKALEVIHQAESISQQMNFDSPLLVVNRALCDLVVNDDEAPLILIEAAASQEYYNMYDRYEVQLAYIMGLALVERYEACVTHAEQFTSSAQAHNPVLYGRGLLWLGFAQFKLGNPQALTTLRWALDNEMSYGGRNLWLCHYALSLVQPDVTHARKNRQIADDLRQQIVDTFANRSDQLFIKTSLGQAPNMFTDWLGLNPPLNGA